MAIGAGSPAAGMFHLSTHAYFKSLLFLTAGAFIHRFHTNDIWEIAEKGGKKEILSISVLCLGLFSLCGIFPFSGFFSKDMILEIIKEKSFLFYSVAIFVSFLTVYYSFRLLFVITLSKINPKYDHEAHLESFGLRLCKALPLVSLALISLVVGALGTPLFNHKILSWLGVTEGPADAGLLLTTTLLIVAGVSIAFFQFRNPKKAQAALESDKNFVKTILDRKFFIDDAYEFMVKKIGLGVAKILDWFDRTVINGFMVNGTSYNVRHLGRFASKLQSGLLQDYISLAVGVGILVVFLVIK